jgi:hypothetical protein
MSRLGDERAAILAALVNAGIRTATTGKLAAPVVLVEPGDPWSEPHRLGSGAGRGRVSRWRLTAIAGAADRNGAYDELADLVDRVDVAVRTLQGAELPSWARPIEQEVAGTRVAFATIATIQYASA